MLPKESWKPPLISAQIATPFIIPFKYSSCAVFPGSATEQLQVVNSGSAIFGSAAFFPFCRKQIQKTGGIKIYCTYS